mgnify:CR=1 FL=1
MTYKAPSAASNPVAPDAVTYSGSLGSDTPVPFDIGFARALRVAQSGDVELVTYDGSTVVIPGVTPGELIQVAFTELKTANTTAQDITIFK